MTLFMASEQEVKRYLAYWFQLGKKVLIRNGNSAVLPQPVIAGDRYSDDFELIWQEILSTESGDCYLEGTHQTIAELLTPQWDVEPCVRCDMPVPIINVGMPPETCPCYDLPTWPNTELPAPRNAVCSQGRLGEIRDRLHKANGNPLTGESLSTNPNTELPAPQEYARNQERLKEIRDRLHQASSRKR